MYLILSSRDQNNIPRRQLHLRGYLHFPTGNSIVLFSELPWLSAQALFPEPVYLWVGGEGEDLQRAACGSVDGERGCAAV